ncbi:MAG: DUF1697 domain-containing protein [Spirochaetes bacterium]|nr:DUF1697 domain-containing protein [Spirochaetota bacterium]
MNRYAVFLRAVNVSGKNPVPMAPLRAELEAAGCRGVKTYLQSGNLILDRSQADEGRLARLVMERIHARFGLEIQALALHGKELTRLRLANPLWPKKGGDGKTFHATIPFSPVDAERFRSLELPARKGERVVLERGILYLHCPDGYGDSKLTNAYFEKALGIVATTRNWNTLCALCDLLDA